MTAQLSTAQCVLLAVHFANEGDIKSLHAFTPSRLDALDPELVLRIILSYLPESIDPSLYTTYVGEVASRIYLQQQGHVDIDTSSVADLSEEQAQKRVKKLKILPISGPNFPPHAPDDLLTRFLCHRSYRIDAETGLLTLVPTLVVPFLDHNEYLRTWFISLILPLLRLGYEYYPAADTPTSLASFEKMDGSQGIELLLANATNTKHEVTSPTDSKGTVARDLRGLVGPWMYGHTERKRRKLNHSKAAEEITPEVSDQSPPARQAFISLEGVSEDDKTGHDWEYAFKWIVNQAIENFALVTNAVEEWDGPGDVDLGPYNQGQVYMDEETQSKLERQYAQAAFASCYAAQADSAETIDGAHGILVRLAELLDFEPPPDLATSVQQLPRIDRHAELLHATDSTVFLEADVLLDPDHPLTTPKLETFMLLQMLVYTAYQLSGLGHSSSIVNVAKLRFFSDEEEQLALLQSILHTLMAKGKRDEQQWQYDYHKLIWLWNWNIDIDESASKGAGIFGKIRRVTIEKELLKVLVASGCYSLIDQLYLSESDGSRISTGEIQQVLLDQTMQSYDSASNGNRTRGSMKKASDLATYALRIFPASEAFRRASALLSATHSLSFYSLKLQHGVPFQPVNIRASSDPLSLLPKVLEQNANSYTKLDDIVSIGRNLVSAGLPLQSIDDEPAVRDEESNLDMPTKIHTAERRVIAMCVEAALSEDDFETAYSYIVNRLAPSDSGLSAASTISTDGKAPESPVPEDDISWRAAFLGGRYRPRDGIPPTLRRLEQRTELLSLALLLAPPASLSEILAVWRRCEEETSSLLAAESAAQESFDDRADKRNSVPGGFEDSRTEGMVFGQQRREVGRFTTTGGGGGGGGRGKGDEEAPMGLFELARGASRAFSRNAFPLRNSATAPAGPSREGGPAGMAESVDSLDSRRSLGHYRSDSAGSGGDAGRVRRRDMVANAVTGGLASGIGWVLGATPADRNAGGAADLH